MKKAYKIALIVTAVLIVLVLALAVAVSPVTKNYVEKHDRELLGRSIRMERLRINIFTGRLRVEGLRIGGTTRRSSSRSTVSTCACACCRCSRTASR